jgi:hypothetical protein
MGISKLQAAVRGLRTRHNIRHTPALERSTFTVIPVPAGQHGWVLLTRAQVSVTVAKPFLLPPHQTPVDALLRHQLAVRALLSNLHSSSSSSSSIRLTSRARCARCAATHRITSQIYLTHAKGKLLALPFRNNHRNNRPSQAHSITSSP